jgi:hypothetical protein
MNTAKVCGTAYRGRLMMSAWTNSQPTGSPGGSSQPSGGAYALETMPISRAEIAQADERVPRALRLRRPRYPCGLASYSLRLALVAGADLPQCQALAVRVSWGMPNAGNGAARSSDSAVQCSGPVMFVSQGVCQQPSTGATVPTAVGPSTGTAKAPTHGVGPSLLRVVW